STAGRLAKTEHLAAALRALGVDEVEIGVSYLSGGVRHRRAGIGWAPTPAGRGGAAGGPPLTRPHAHRPPRGAPAAAGGGSGTARKRILGVLFARATADEQEFLARLLIGELRQGALEGVLAEAIAKASGVDAPAVRRALMLSGDAGSVARAALANGAAGLA